MLVSPHQRITVSTTDLAWPDYASLAHPKARNAPKHQNSLPQIIETPSRQPISPTFDFWI